jgi:hypothetical protein
MHGGVTLPAADRPANPLHDVPIRAYPPTVFHRTDNGSAGVYAARTAPEAARPRSGASGWRPTRAEGSPRGDASSLPPAAGRTAQTL